MALLMPELQITKEQAIKIAVEYAAQRDWPIFEPYAVEDLRTWTIWTRSNYKPSPWVKIDGQTGNVLEANFPPR